MSQSVRRPILLLLALALVACGPRRPDFDIDKARAQLGEAFSQPEEEVSILSEGKAPERPGEVREVPEFWVDFKVPSFRRTLQARFLPKEADWVLDGVRERPRGNQETAWLAVGDMLGEVRAAAAEKSTVTMDTMRELAGAIEAYAVDAGNEFPGTDIKGLARLMTRGRYFERWNHSDDGWGNALYYYASDSGDAYILVSRGADNRFDIALDGYNAKTDAGDFAYEGATSDPSRDLIYATGSFVQRYVPGE